MKKFLKIIVFSLITLAFASTALAFNWKEVNSDDFAKYYVDTETVAKNPVGGWVKVLYTDNSVRDKEMETLKSAISEIDWSDYSYRCDKIEYKNDENGLQMRKLCTVFYSSKDAVIFVDDFPTDWEKVEIGTLGENMYNALKS